MQRPASPPAPSAPSPVRPPALNKEWLRQMQQQQQEQQQQQGGDDSVRETVQTNLVHVHKSLVDEMERHSQALTLIYAGRPTAALASSAHTQHQHRQHPSDGTGTSSHSTGDSRGSSPLPLLDDEESLAMYYKKLEQQQQQQQQRHQRFVSDGREEEEEEEEEEGEDGQQSKGMYATCTTFASRFPGEQEEGEEPAPSGILEDERVTELLELERFEKSIFVKAALQLLLDKAGGGSGSSSSSSSSDYSGGGVAGISSSTNSTNTPASTKTAGRVSLSLSVALPHDDAALPISLSSLPPSSTSSTSILKAGLLKKANHHAMGAIWKTKLVEVHQGLFVYEDDDSLMGRRRKSLPLHASICSCKPVASKKNNVFELALKKGAKRLWMCTSEEERNEWVHAINSATVVLPPGGGVGGQAIDPSSPYAGDMMRYRDLRISVEGAEDREGYQRAVASLLEKEELCVPFPWIRGQIFPSSSSSSASSSTGSVAPSSLPFYLKYARRRTQHPHHSHHHNLYSPSAPSHHHHHQPQHSSAGAGGSSSSSSSGSSALTQLWKDMMRDKVCINGQIIYGESGPEAILGALARALSTLAQKAKEHEQEEASRSLSLPASLGGLSLSTATAAAAAGSGSPHHTRAHTHSSHHTQHRLSSSVAADGFPPPLSSSLSTSPRPPLSALNEVQVVSHTMEILLACNRTQSGGDTYYCVEYLFRNPQLVVVCPYSSHAEPLHISLELVEEESVMSVVSPSPPPSLPSPLVMSPEQQQPEEEKEKGGSGGGHRYSFALRAGKARGPGSASSSPQRWHRADSLPTQVLQSGPTTEAAAASSPVSPPQQQQQQQQQQQSAAVPARALSPSSTFSRTLPLSAPAGGRQQLQQTGVHFYDFESPGRSSSSSSTVGGISSPFSDVEQRPISSGAATATATATATAPPAVAPIAREGSLRRPVILVKIQANTSYKVCPLDPQDGDDNDIWGLVSARFEQQFIVSGAGLAKSDELIRLKTTAVNSSSSSGSSNNNAEEDNQTNRPLSASTQEQQQQQQQQGGDSVLNTPPRPSSSGGKAGEQDQQQQQQQQQQQRQTTAGSASPPDGAT